LAERLEKQYGRDFILDLVRDVNVRPLEKREPRNPFSPVVVLEGSRGSGKTFLLKELHAEMDEHLPCVRLDLADHGQSTVTDILIVLADTLNRRHPGYGRLDFPRLGIAVIAAKAKLNGFGGGARDEMVKALDQYKRLEDLGAYVATVAQTIPLLPKIDPEVVKAPARAAMLGASKWPTLQRILLGRALRWFASDKHDAIDELVGLNRIATGPGEKGKRVLGQRMMAAFLADLRAEFAAGGPSRRERNCAILLDNVDGGTQSRFVRDLVDSRREYNSRNQDSDPVTVVVTSRGALLGSTAERYLPSDSGYPGFLRRTGQNPQDVRWLRCPLPDLSLDDIGDMVRDNIEHAEHPDRVRQTTFEVTGGQPAAARLFLKCVAADPAHIDPEQVLSGRLPELDPRLDEDLVPAPDLLSGAVDNCDVEEIIRTRLMHPEDIADDVYEALVTCSVARDRDQAHQMAARSNLVNSDLLRQLAAVSARVWPEDGNDRIPLIRRLLQRRLAARPDGESDSWSGVHGWLATECGRAKDEPGVLHHTLAAGDVMTVALSLKTRLGRLSGGDLLSLLDTITSAPNRLDRSVSPAVQVESLVREFDPQGTPLVSLTRLIAGLWIAADPMIRIERRDLHMLIANNFATVAGFCSENAARLLDRAEEHEEFSRLWERPRRRGGDRDK
jgi:hypothetical protein